MFLISLLFAVIWSAIGGETVETLLRPAEMTARVRTGALPRALAAPLPRPDLLFEAVNIVAQLVDTVGNCFFPVGKGALQRRVQFLDLLLHTPLVAQPEIFLLVIGYDVFSSSAFNSGSFFASKWVQLASNPVEQVSRCGTWRRVGGAMMQGCVCHDRRPSLLSDCSQICPGESEIPRQDKPTGSARQPDQRIALFSGRIRV
jgi:hypothetical protein